MPILPGCVESGCGCTTAGSIQRQNGAASTSSGYLDVTYSSAPRCLAGAPAAARAAVAIRLANSSVLSDVGLYTFNIYLVQDMLASEFLKLQAFSAGACSSYLACNALVVDGMYTSSPYGSFDNLWWSIYAATLVGLCKAWCIHVETPWMKWLRKQLAPPQTLLPL